MNFEDLTGKELRDIETVTGTTLMAGLENAEETGNFDAAFAYLWISRRRLNTTLTFDDVLESASFKEAMDAMNMGNEASDPGKGNGGTTQPSSAATGG